MTCTHESHQASRLTPADWETMRNRIDATIAGWVHSAPTRKYRVTATDTLSLDRLALAAIGCTTADMRDTELAELAAYTADLIGRTYKPSAAQWHRITEAGRK